MQKPVKASRLDSVRLRGQGMASVLDDALPVTKHELTGYLVTDLAQKKGLFRQSVPRSKPHRKREAR